MLLRPGASKDSLLSSMVTSPWLRVTTGIADVGAVAFVIFRVRRRTGAMAEWAVIIEMLDEKGNDDDKCH